MRTVIMPSRGNPFISCASSLSSLSAFLWLSPFSSFHQCTISSSITAIFIPLVALQWGKRALYTSAEGNFPVGIMKITTSLALLLAAFLLFGCIKEKTEEGNAAQAMNASAANTSAENAATPNATGSATPAPEQNTGGGAAGATAQNTIAGNGTLENKTAENETAAVSPAPLVYFYSALCPFCANSSVYLSKMQLKYPD